MAPPESAPAPRWLATALALATAAYAIALVWATHYPRVERLIGPNAPPDKALHAYAYAGLALLSAATLAASGGWTLRRVAVLAAGLALFGVVDELTQPLFSRDAEWFDWLCDCLGIATGIAPVAALVVVSRLLTRRTT